MRTLFFILSLTIDYPSKLLLRTDRRSSASWRINHVYFQSWSNQQSPLQLVVMRSYVRTVESAQARTNSSVVGGSSQTARLSVLPKSVRRPSLLSLNRESGILRSDILPCLTRSFHWAERPSISSLWNAMKWRWWSMSTCLAHGDTKTKRVVRWNNERYFVLLLVWILAP